MPALAERDPFKIPSRLLFLVLGLLVLAGASCGKKTGSHLSSRRR